MGLKFDKCCGYFELRKGCIAIGTVELILAVVAVAWSPSFSNTAIISIINLILAVTGCGCLIYVAAFINRNHRSRSFAAIVYIVLSLLGALIRVIAVILLCITIGKIMQSERENKSNIIHIQQGSYIGRLGGAVTHLFFSIILKLYFARVVFSFYQELKIEDKSTLGGNA